MDQKQDNCAALPRMVESVHEPSIDFSICTLVTEPLVYRKMCASFRLGGFDTNDVEFLYIDNTNANRFDAFSGLNCLITQSRGKYIILCHQDVLLLSDDRKKLVERLQHLDVLDSSWALAGNAGATHERRPSICITDLKGIEHRSKQLPQRVASLDENFILLKRESCMGFSRDLTGFHFYGADICLQAEWRGWSAYVIDFHLRHNGLGARDETFNRIRADLERKYERLMRPRIVRTTCSELFFGQSRRVDATKAVIKAQFRHFERSIRPVVKRLLYVTKRIVRRA